MVTSDEIAPGQVMRLQTVLNGQVLQDTTTDKMIHNIPRQIAYISTFIPLSPGDVIVTGTPGGVGNKRNPQIFMKPGDVCEIVVDAIGTLRNGIRDDARYYRDLYAPDAAGWRQTQKALAEFATATRDIGAKLVVFHLPELRELRPYPFADVTAKVRTAVEKDRVPFYDLLPTVENLPPASLWVTVPDPHPNANAMKAFTAGMVPRLRTSAACLVP